MHGRYYDAIGIIDEPVRLDFDVFCCFPCDWISRKKVVRVTGRVTGTC